MGYGTIEGIDWEEQAGKHGEFHCKSGKIVRGRIDLMTKSFFHLSDVELEIPGEDKRMIKEAMVHVNSTELYIPIEIREEAVFDYQQLLPPDHYNFPVKQTRIVEYEFHHSRMTRTYPEKPTKTETFPRK